MVLFSLSSKKRLIDRHLHRRDGHFDGHGQLPNNCTLTDMLLNTRAVADVDQDFKGVMKPA